MLALQMTNASSKTLRIFSYYPPIRSLLRRDDKNIYYSLLPLKTSKGFLPL